MKALKQQKVLYYCFEKLKLPFLKKISSRFNHHADHVYLLRAWLPYCCLFSNRSFSMHLIQCTWYAHMIHSMHLHHMYMQFSITYTTSKNNAYMKMSPERGKFYQNVYFYIMLGRWLCFPMFLKWNKMANYTEKKKHIAAHWWEIPFGRSNNKSCWRFRYITCVTIPTQLGTYLVRDGCLHHPYRTGFHKL